MTTGKVSAARGQLLQKCCCQKGRRGQNRDIPSSSKPVVGEEGSSSSPYPISQSGGGIKAVVPVFVFLREVETHGFNESRRAEASDASSACPCWRGSTVGNEREAAVNSPLENIPLVQEDKEKIVDI